MSLYPGMRVKTTYENHPVRVGTVENVSRFSATILHDQAHEDEKPERSSHHFRWLEPIEK